MSVPLKIILDVQHMGKPHNPTDRGARHENLIESDLCLQYAANAHKLLTEAGHHPFLITHGYYGQRAAFANQIEADLYLACHLNSSITPPSQNYSLVEISELAGQTTKELAQVVSNMFKEKLPVANSWVRTIAKGERGWSCINRVKAPALLLEPFFINCSDVQLHITQDIWLVSEAIVQAILDFNWRN